MLPGEEGLHREVAAPGAPFLVLLGTTGSDEPTGRVHRGEDPDDAISSPDLFNQALHHVRDPKALAVFWGKRKYGSSINVPFSKSSIC